MNARRLLVLTTCPDAAVADRIAAALVEERLAACVNRLGPVESVFRWRGTVSREREWLLLIKTCGEVLARLEQRIRDLHPYEVPEIVALAIVAGSAEYLAWLDAGVAASPTNTEPP